MLDEEMDGVAREERDKLAILEDEQVEMRRKMDRLWRVVETSDMEVNDILPRLRVHQEAMEQLERAAQEAREVLAERREMLDSVDVIARFVEEMGVFLRTSAVTESKSFIRSFVKRIGIMPGRAVIHYTIPTPPDSPLEGADLANLVLTSSHQVQRGRA